MSNTTELKQRKDNSKNTIETLNITDNNESINNSDEITKLSKTKALRRPRFSLVENDQTYIYFNTRHH